MALSASGATTMAAATTEAGGGENNGGLVELRACAHLAEVLRVAFEFGLCEQPSHHQKSLVFVLSSFCLLYTSDAADE